MKRFTVLPLVAAALGLGTVAFAAANAAAPSTGSSPASIPAHSWWCPNVAGGVMPSPGHAHISMHGMCGF